MLQALHATGAEIGVRLLAQQLGRGGDVAENLNVGHAARGSTRRREIIPRTWTKPGKQMWSHGGDAVVRQLARDLFGPLVPTGHVVNDYYAGDR